MAKQKEAGILNKGMKKNNYEQTVLGTGLFDILINYLGKGIEGSLIKLEDNSKFFRSVGLLEGRKAAQKDLDRLDPWAKA